MVEKISVQSVTDIITSKAGREYFTFEDIGQKRYVCFIVKLKEFCKVGTEIEADFTLGKSADDSPRLDMIYVDGKPVITIDKKGRSPFKGRDEDRTDRRNAIITIKDIWLSGKIKDDNFLVTWLLAELLVIATGKKEAKSDTKTNSKSKATDQQQSEERTSGPPSGEALELLPEEGLLPGETERVAKFLNWIKTKDENISDPRLWLEVEYAIAHDESLSDKKCEALYKTIKQKKGW